MGKMVSTTSLALLLVLASAAAASATDSNKMLSPMFVDWITQQTSHKAKAANFVEPMEATETANVCLTQTKLRNCRCLNRADDDTCCQRLYEEITLSCCDHHKGPSAFMTEGSLMGVCSWVSDFFDESHPVKYDYTQTQKLGVYTVKCEMREESDKCGSPLCEGMSLEGSGDILSYDKVAFIGDSSTEPIAVDNSCGSSEHGTAERRMSRSMAASSSVRAKNEIRGKNEIRAKNESGTHARKLQEYVYDNEQVRFYVGQGTIYSGTFRVTSRFHASKFSTGQMQVAFPADTTELSQHAPAGYEELHEKAYIARAEQLNLEFFKDGKDTY